MNSTLNPWKRLSLRSKLICLLVVVPTVSLLIFLNIAIRIFESDKTAYVFGTNSSLATSLAPQVATGIKRLSTLASTVVANLGPQGELSSTGRSFLDNESAINEVRIFERKGRNAKLIFEKASEGEPLSEKLDPDVTALSPDDFPRIFATEDGRREIAFFVQRDQDEIIILLGVSEDAIALGFNETGAQKTLLVRDDGTVILPMSAASAAVVQDLFRGAFASSLNLNNAGVEQVETSDGSKKLVSYADVGIASLKVLVFADDSVTGAAIASLVREAAVALFGVIGVVLILSVFASRALTSTLARLTEAAARIAKGDFGSKIGLTTQDEVGILAQGFDRMTVEVERLLEETASKARMEQELEMGRAVQTNLFPKEYSKTIGGKVEVAGFYEPASECGGDWWFYNEVNGYTYLWMGDATGHGVPAALFTSAARAAVAVIQQSGNLEPSDCLQALNAALYQTGGGGMAMTFFLIRIDNRTGEVLYSNASHEHPYVLRGSTETITHKSFDTLDANTNPRLGENPDATFHQSSFKLEDGDVLLLYTDGVYEITNDSGDELGRRRFQKLLANALLPKVSPEASLETLLTGCKSWQGNQSLNDDVTLLMARFRKSA